MLKIRLRRVGARKRPAYRVVVVDSRVPRDGTFVEVIGHYDPITDPPTITVDQDKAQKWLTSGAQPTDSAARILAKLGLIEGFKAPTVTRGAEEVQAPGKKAAQAPES
ncbi:MAG: 30S ribosomal protein S16 [Chloroflexi bacterium]|nr:30S ribosomal protein S16 [Chloroflexota bacterium]